MPLVRAILRHAGERPHSPAFRTEGRVLTFGELAAAAGRILHAIEQAALQTREQSVLAGRVRLIALETGNHPLFAAAFIAATSGGNCAALIDPHLPDSSRQRMKEKLRPEIVIRADGDHLCLDVPSVGQTLALETFDGSSAIRIGDDAEPFLVVFTSGTTGDPKAIIRDRRSWRLSLETGQEFFGIGPETATYAPGPLAHGLALYALVECLAAGAEFVGARHFEPRQALDVIGGAGTKRLVLVPTMLRRLCEQAKGAALTSVEKITVAGAKLTPADRSAAARAFPAADAIEYYGASELGFITVAGADDNHSPTAVGKPFPGVRLTILDDRGNNLPPGETGTIFVESALISEGYIASGDGDGFSPRGAARHRRRPRISRRGRHAASHRPGRRHGAFRRQQYLSFRNRSGAPGGARHPGSGRFRSRRSGSRQRARGYPSDEPRPVQSSSAGPSSYCRPAALQTSAKGLALPGDADDRLRQGRGRATAAMDRGGERCP
ncbi:long-chain acyl-CoA synthetase [Sinorhizobium fredii]